VNRLLLLSGATRRAGWIRLDGNRRHGPDILATIPPLPVTVTERAWDEIELAHGISSFYPWQAASLLASLREVMAPGGILWLEQPDIVKAAHAVARTGTMARVPWLFGDPEPEDEWHMNRWGYTPAALRTLLLEAGWSLVEEVPPLRHPERDFRLKARP
jgi:hypothetical protein